MKKASSAGSKMALQTPTFSRASSCFFVGFRHSFPETAFRALRLWIGLASRCGQINGEATSKDILITQPCSKFQGLIISSKTKKQAFFFKRAMGASFVLLTHVEQTETNLSNTLLWSLFPKLTEWSFWCWVAYQLLHMAFLFSCKLIQLSCPVLLEKFQHE